MGSNNKLISHPYHRNPIKFQQSNARFKNHATLIYIILPIFYSRPTIIYLPRKRYFAYHVTENPLTPVSKNFVFCRGRMTFNNTPHFLLWLQTNFIRFSMALNHICYLYARESYHFQYGSLALLNVIWLQRY